MSRPRPLRPFLLPALAGVLTAVGIAGLPVAPAVAAPVPGDQLVQEVPAEETPDVLAPVEGGRAFVYSVAESAGRVVLGGDFERARDASERGTDTAAVDVANLLAFDPVTGAVDRAFAQVPDGVVNVVLADPDGTTLWVGGRFTEIGGVARRNLAALDASTGAVLPRFDPGVVDGPVEDLRLVDGRLWVAGGFGSVDGRAQPGLATLAPVSGRFLPFMRRPVTGLQKPGQGSTDVRKIDVTRDGRRLVGVGNFRKVGGQVRRQLLVLDIGGRRAQVAPWRTSFYAPDCARVYDSYVKDVDLSPDGTWFAVATTGANGGPGSPCDAVTRFETRSGAADVRPTWVANTGGDTTWAVEADDGILYTGGHYQWQNNAYGLNKDQPGPGAVVRTGLAALDPRNGLPLDWNPTRTRGKGVFDFLRSERGLYVASDTDRIGQGQFLRGRIALLPAGGEVVPAPSEATLPAEVLQLDGPGGGSTDVLARDLDARGRATGPAREVGGEVDWSGVRAGFLLDGRVYAAREGGSLTVQELDDADSPGETPAVEDVDAADQVVPMTQWHDEVGRVTSLFHDDGRIYYTLAGSRQLFSRAFTPWTATSPGDAVVGTVRTVASGPVRGFRPQQVNDAFLAGDSLFWSDAAGVLRRTAWASTPYGGSPRPRTTSVVPVVRDGAPWTAAALVVRSR